MISGLFRQLMRQPSLRAATAKYSNKTSVPGDNEIIRDEEEDKKLNVAEFIVDDEGTDTRAAYIAKIRNKSGLLDQHRRQVLEQIPYDAPQSWVHLTVAYQRKMYGRYGAASGVDPRIMFPTAEDLADKAEYERVAHPKTLHEMMAEEKAAAEAKEAAKRKREDEIAKKLAKLDQWTNELNARVAKKEADARAAREKRERLVEDVRRQFGFRLDHHDPRFQELIEQKEQEDKKASKAMKKQKKQELDLKRLQQQFEDKNEQLKRPEDTPEKPKEADVAPKKAKKK